jgi:hypothetical protein
MSCLHQKKLPGSNERSISVVFFQQRIHLHQGNSSKGYGVATSVHCQAQGSQFIRYIDLTAHLANFTKERSSFFAVL